MNQTKIKKILMHISHIERLAYCQGYDKSAYGLTDRLFNRQEIIEEEKEFIKKILEE